MRVANTSQCVICGSGDVVSVSTAVGERLYCRGCFHGWRTEIPDYSYAASIMCAKGTAPERQRSQIEFIAPFLADGASVLEIGCAGGEFAKAIRAAMPVGRYDAIELSPVGENARPHLDRLYDQPLRKLMRDSEGLGKYDLIVMSHVLEHLEDVHAETNALALMLTDDGSLFVEVPNRSGHPGLPIDDNVSHLHFFSPASLLRLLSEHGLEAMAVETSARLDARYADSLRVVARAFSPPAPDMMLLSKHPLLAGETSIVVWGAGSVACELLANFLDIGLIDFFIDGNVSKHGSSCLGRPVRAPDALGEKPRTVLIASVDYADEIRDTINRHYPHAGHRMVRIEDIIETTGTKPQLKSNAHGRRGKIL